jgi:hypothetical protein
MIKFFAERLPDDTVAADGAANTSRTRNGSAVAVYDEVLGIARLHGCVKCYIWHQLQMVEGRAVMCH